MVNKRMGRPPKPNTQKKSKTVQVRMTGAEYRRLAEEAKKAGLRVSELVRRKAKGE
jgi:hypothetical protein